jgi:cation diffusion facilitator family transporter
MAECGCEPIAVETAEQRRTLRIALGLNAAMFVVEVTAGWLGQSMGLIAEGLDNLTDAAAYGVAIVAIGGSPTFKARAATVSGGVLLLLGIGVLVEVARRAIYGEAPEGVLMIVVAGVSLAVNWTVLRLLGKYRDSDVHLRATWIFTRADVIANVALICSGSAVLLSGFRFIDLIVGAGIGLYVIKEAIEILSDAHRARRSEPL